jgi:hypothetical protein
MVLEGKIKVAYLWMHSWLFNLETIAELEESQSLFFKWANTCEVKDSIGEDLHSKLMTFVRVSLQPKLAFLALPYRLFVESLDEHTTAISEGLNSSTKCGPAAVKPNMSIAKSRDKMLTQTTQREHKQVALNESQTLQERVWLQDNALQDLTNYMAGVGSTFFDASKGLCLLQMSNTKWLMYNEKTVSAGCELIFVCSFRRYRVRSYGFRSYVCCSYGFCSYK